MDYEVLVNALRHLLILLQQEHGQVALFMLKAVETEANDWNLIVSTQTYDHVPTKQALSQLVNLTNTHLAPDIRKHILRFTILKTDDAFVKEMNSAYPVTHAPQYIQSAFIAGISIEKAVILASHHLPATTRTRLHKKQPHVLLEHA